jgi:hypothetical protein
MRKWQKGVLVAAAGLVLGQLLVPVVWGQADWMAYTRIRQGMTKAEVEQVHGRLPDYGRNGIVVGGKDATQDTWHSPAGRIVILFDFEGRVVEKNLYSDYQQAKAH